VRRPVLFYPRGGCGHPNSNVFVLIKYLNI
jgi:hypothetical protein